MSRTIKGAKGAGYDFWSRRPGSGHSGYGPYAKLLTHRIERRLAKKDSRKAAESICADGIAALRMLS